MSFSRSWFLKTFLSFFIGLNSFFIIILYYGPAASLFRLNLSNANLRTRNLAGVKNLRWANLNGAILENTDLRGADLENAVGLTSDQLALAITDEHTILPENIKRERAAAAAQRLESIETDQAWSEARSTENERVIDLKADVLFGFNETTIPSDAVPILEKLAREIQRSGDVSVHLNGHTDSKGTPQYNQHLSERRADAVKQWLTTVGGINPERLKTRGYGSTQPIAADRKPDGSDDSEGRRKNRRVEIRIPTSGRLAAQRSVKSKDYLVVGGSSANGSGRSATV